MMRCSKTGLTDQDFKTILDVLNVYDPNDIIEHIPEMASPEFMQDVQSAFKAVLAHVNRSKYGSDLGAADGLDAEDHAEADKQHHREDRIKELAADMPSAEPLPLERAAYERHMANVVHEQYIHGLS